MSFALNRRPAALIAVLVLAVIVAGFLLPWQRLGVEIVAVQRVLHDELVAALRAVKAHEAAALWGLIGVSLAYGVFHAAGPGHGKAVIATYVATSGQRLRQGLMLSVLSALAQGVTAIAVTGVAVWLLEQSLRQAQATALAVETVSFGLIGLVGVVLALAGAMALRRHPHAHHHRHDHHDHDCGHHCGHAHGPTAADLAGRQGWRRSAGVILAIGLRPCSGAILVLLFAHAMDMPLAGIAAVVAMSVGTAATVAALACLAVHARRWALASLARAQGGQGHLHHWIEGARLTGGLLIALIGFSLLWRALDGGLAPPPF